MSRPGAAVDSSAPPSVSSSVCDEAAGSQAGTSIKKTRFNPFSVDFRRDPYATYETLRSDAPVHRIMGSWLLSRYGDITSVLKDRRFSSSSIPHIVRRGGTSTGQCDHYKDYQGIESFIEKAIVFTENPSHSRLRRLVASIFSQSAVEAEGAKIEEIGRALLRRPLAEGGMNLISDFADKIPMYLMCERLGVSYDHGPFLRDWAHEARLLLDPTLMSKKDFIRVEGVMQEALSFLQELVYERVRKPGSDTISQLLASRDRGNQLSHEEVALICFMSFVAGHETTQHLIGNAALCLMQYRAQAQKLRSEPSLLENTVEETMRFEAPLQQTKRVVVTDLMFSGHRFAEGDQVLLLLGSANRDAAVFDHPNQFIITRENASAHLGFGYGMRNCLGAALAVFEAKVACKLLFCGMTIPRLCREEAVWQNESIILRGLHDLPVYFSNSE